MNEKNSRLVLTLSAFLVGLVLCFTVVMMMSGNTGAPVAPSAIGGAFSLTDQNGKAVTDADIKGKPHLVFFGFTHCPDICPTTLFEVSEVMRTLGSDANRAGALFITVDPERDTPAALKDYLGSFDPRIRGLTGDTAAISAVERAYRVYAKKVPTSAGDYTMDHTAIVYLMDKEGRFVRPFDLKRKPEEAAADLRKFL
jgi:protein SCO1/2